MLSVASFNKVQPFSWPLWIQSESCYERIVICERYDSSDPTCSGYLGSNGFRATGGKNELEIEGRYAMVLFQHGGRLTIGGSVWKTTIGLTEGTSVLNPAYNIDLMDCPSMVSVRFSASTIIMTANYTFLCGNDSEIIEPSQTEIVYFKDLRTCSDSQNVLLIAVRQGNNTMHACMRLWHIIKMSCIHMTLP